MNFQHLKDQSALEINRCMWKETFNPFLGLMQLLPGIRGSKCGTVTALLRRVRKIVTVVCSHRVIIQRNCIKEPWRDHNSPFWFRTYRWQEDAMGNKDCVFPLVSMMFLYLLIHCQGWIGSRAYPRNTGCKSGTHPKWDASPLQNISIYTFTHSFTPRAIYRSQSSYNTSMFLGGEGKAENL